MRFKQLIKTFGKYLIIVPVVALFIFFCLFFKGLYVNAVDKYSKVLDDLQTDSSFHIDDYPSKTYSQFEDNTEIKIIQIAESTSHELYIYTYQLYSDVKVEAYAISMSVDYSSTDNIRNTQIYQLDKVDSYGVFYKYVVKDFKVCSERDRYYNIVSIYRYSVGAIDKEDSNLQDMKRAIKVGQQWYATEVNNKVVYEMCTFETMQLSDIFTSFIECPNGTNIGEFIFNDASYARIYYITFNCEEYKIKHIFDSNITFKVRNFEQKYNGSIKYSKTYPNGEDGTVKKLTLSDTDTMNYKGNGFGSRKFSWSRICTSGQFIKDLKNQNISFNDNFEDVVSSHQWVYSFYESEIINNGNIIGIGTGTIKGQEVFDTTILTIHFMDFTGKIYNLGVVADMVTSTDKSSASFNVVGLNDIIEKILLIIGFILLAVLIIFLVPVLVIVFNGVVLILKIIFHILKIPFDVIGSVLGVRNKNK